MIVYHGTGDYSLESLVREGPKLYPRAYLGWKKAFSTTTDFKIATLFSLRRSPPEALRDERRCGVVLEYEIKEAQRGKGWRPAVCPGCSRTKRRSPFSRWPR